MSSIPFPNTLLENYAAAMNVYVPEWKEQEAIVSEVFLNIGAGNKHINEYTSLSLDQGWKAPLLSDYEDDSVDGIITYHFLEFLSREEFMTMMREFQRVLVTGGLVNIAVPYWNSEQAIHDINNQLYFSEKTFQHLLERNYYDMAKITGQPPFDWKLKVRSQIIMGHTTMNMMLMVQLEKGK